MRTIFRQINMFTVLVLASSFAVLGQAAEVGRIESSVASLDEMTKSAVKPQLIFADISDFSDGKGKPVWKKFESEEALTDYRETRNETYEIAFVWMKDGQVAVSNFTLFSPSGDWAQYDLHYFRPDGSIAKIVSELHVTFLEFGLKRELWFDPKGIQIAATQTYSNLESGQRIRKPKDSFDTDIKRFNTVSDLPFSSLVPVSR